MEDPQCKNCRRLGIKLFLKGERCNSPKCAMVRKPYNPGNIKKKRKSTLSEYGRELREKQRLKDWYNLRERQFSNYVKKVLGKRGGLGDASVLLIRSLEKRLDNVIFRIGFGQSHAQARQLVNHGHFLVNGKPINIPSYQVRVGDIISMHPSASKKVFFKNLTPALKKHKGPSWIDFDQEKIEAKITGEPSIEEVSPPADITAIFEFYSR